MPCCAGRPIAPRLYATIESGCYLDGLVLPLDYEGYDPEADTHCWRSVEVAIDTGGDCDCSLLTVWLCCGPDGLGGYDWQVGFSLVGPGMAFCFPMIDFGTDGETNSCDPFEHSVFGDYTIGGGTTCCNSDLIRITVTE